MVGDRYQASRPVVRNEIVGATHSANRLWDPSRWANGSAFIQGPLDTWGAIMKRWLSPFEELPSTSLG